MKLCKQDILIAEVELTGICNLKCPLCVSMIPQFKDVIRKHSVDFCLLKNKLSEFSNLKQITIAGLSTEPTMYANLFNLLDYCNERKIIVRLYTNGELHDDNWWNDLSKHMKINDECIFTVCGSTQELHAKYRVGSNLKTMLKHASCFRNSNKNDRLVIIKFEYNKNDVNNMKNIANEFSKFTIINSQTYNEQFNVLPNDSGICIEHKKAMLYKYFANKIDPSEFNLECQSYNDKSIVIDNYCNVFPCNYARLNGICFTDDNSYDYDNIIVDEKHEFCKECDKTIKYHMKKLDIEGFNGNG